MVNSELQNHTALVTGASRGIGRAIALEIGRLGAFVIGTAKSDAGVRDFAGLLKRNTLEGLSLGLDVSKQASVDVLLQELDRRKLSPTILVNNAGVTRDGLLLRMRVEDWQEVLDTNLSSVFRITKAFVRGMVKARYGRIINIASVVGLRGNPGQTNYAAAKAGILGFTKSLALELGSRGITVNAVAPGFVDTDMTRHFNAAERERILSRIPMSRFGSTEDVAAVVAFLASPRSGYITGETINISGGMYMA
ncbi:MAG: 3-oxoacyl-ACP reductase FabG [Gammaproteobacteria bacterium]